MKKLLLITLLLVCTKQVNAQIITTIAGNGTGAGTNPCSTCYGGDNAQATAAEINAPFGVAIDGTGNLYIADYYNNRIRKVTTAGIITTVAGNGTAGFSGDGAQAVAAELYNPYGITLDAAGNLYITDQVNQRIRKVTPSGIITTIAGNGTNGYSGDGGQATAAELNSPTNVILDDFGNLYIADYYNNVIRKINTLGIISTIAGTGTQGYSGDGGQATAAEINQPVSFVFDASGNLYIADEGNYVIRKINTLGIISTIAGNGTFGYSGDNSAATAAELSYPYGVTIDAIGNLYIADEVSSRIRMVNIAGIISTIAGDGTQGYSGDGAQAITAELYYPTSIVFDAAGNLYIADNYNNRIRKVTNVAAAGIEQYANNEIEVNIYPNPNNGSFVIEPQNTLYNVHCTVYDVNGKVVLSQAITGKTSIDAGSLNDGVYNISLQSNEGVVNKRLVIVR
jgi:sugar lactone lactonase YvrE